jgi:hypothetical protein
VTGSYVFHGDNQFRRPTSIVQRKLLKSETRRENIQYSPTSTVDNHLTRRIIGSAVKNQTQRLHNICQTQRGAQAP